MMYEYSQNGIGNYQVPTVESDEFQILPFPQ